MVHQDKLRHVSNEMPDYDAFIASLPKQQLINEEGSTPHTPSFLSTIECDRLQEIVRSWMLQRVQLTMKAWSPSSPQSPTSVRGQTKQDFSIYVGTGNNCNAVHGVIDLWCSSTVWLL